MALQSIEAVEEGIVRDGMEPKKLLFASVTTQKGATLSTLPELEMMD